MKVHFTKAKGKGNYKVKMMTIMVQNLSMERKNERKDRIETKEEKQEHIYEKNGMIMEGKDEGKGSL